MLNDQRRSQLDNIVLKMIENGEPDENIQFVVNDFKRKYTNEPMANEKIGQPQESKSLGRKVVDFFTSGEQGFGATLGQAAATLSKDFKGATESQSKLDDMTAKLGDAIVAGRKSGKDTSRLEALYKENTGQQFDLGGILPATEKSTKQIAGEGLAVAADVASFGSYSTGIKGAMGAKSAGQAFLKGAAKMAPEGAAMGAGFAASEALREDKSMTDVVKQTASGIVSGAIINGVIGGLVARSKFLAPDKSEKIRQEAIAQYKKGLQATKEKYKEKSDKIIPSLLDKNWWGTRKQLLQKTDEGIELATKEYEMLGELKGVIEIDGLIKNIDQEIAKNTLASGRVSSVNSQKVKALEELRADILAVDAFDKIKDGVASQQALRDLAADYGKEVYDTRKAQKTIMDNKTLSQVKKVDSWIRNMLNKDPRNVKYAEINKMFHLNNELGEILQETAFRKEGHKVANLIRVLSGGSGLSFGAAAFGGLPGAIASGAGLLAFTEVINSTWWNTLRAVQKNRLAEKLMTKSATEMSQVLRIFAKQGIKAVEEYVKD